ncbi:MAG: RNA 2',3'-cyclic phosphodiesterase [Actinomycetota bacterium]|nr:RNA 2',3'-cyclic phosphodiesterase [Actinomycetota bacterium]
MAKQRLKSPRARLFVALELPAELRDGIVEWQRRELRDPALRAVKPESLHMTLAFLGYRPEKEIESIAEVALGRGGAGSQGPPPAPEIELDPDPVAVPRRRPRLFALDARSDSAAALQAQVSIRLEQAHFYEPEKRPFWPHLTVARVRPEKRGGRKPAAVESPPGPLTEHTFLRPIPLVRLVLFRSHLRREGALYEPMAELELPTGPMTENETER